MLTYVPGKDTAKPLPPPPLVPLAQCSGMCVLLVPIAARDCDAEQSAFEGAQVYFTRFTQPCSLCTSPLLRAPFSFSSSFASLAASLAAQRIL